METILNFVDIINEIEAELAPKYEGGAIKWTDDHYDNAWSNTIQRMIDAVDNKEARQRDPEYLKREAAHYKKTVLGYIARYKKEKNIDDAQMFLDHIMGQCETNRKTGAKVLDPK